MKAALIAVFLEVALSFGLILALARARVAAISSGAVKIKDTALRQEDPWPEQIRQINASYQSQFELPVLFYALIALALVSGKLDVPLTIGAWIFVATRYAHAYVHLTTNHVPTRFRFFAGGVFVLALSWIYFAVRLLVE